MLKQNDFEQMLTITNSEKYCELKDKANLNYLHDNTNVCSTKHAEQEIDNISMRTALLDVVLKSIPSSCSLLIENTILFFNLLFLGTLNDSILLSG